MPEEPLEPAVRLGRSAGVAGYVGDSSHLEAIEQRVGVERLAPGYVFLFFCFMMFLQLLWVIFMVPETKGVSLEAIQDRLVTH